MALYRTLGFSHYLEETRFPVGDDLVLIVSGVQRKWSRATLLSAHSIVGATINTWESTCLLYTNFSSPCITYSRVGRFIIAAIST